MMGGGREGDKGTQPTEGGEGGIKGQRLHRRGGGQGVSSDYRECECGAMRLQRRGWGQGV